MTKDPQLTDNPITVLLPLCVPQSLICNRSSSSGTTLPFLFVSIGAVNPHLSTQQKLAFSDQAGRLVGLFVSLME